MGHLFILFLLFLNCDLFFVFFVAETVQHYFNVLNDPKLALNTDKTLFSQFIFFFSEYRGGVTGITCSQHDYINMWEKDKYANICKYVKQFFLCFGFQ